MKPNGATIPGLLATTVARHGDRPAVVDGDQRLMNVEDKVVR